jgi:hypothetical protein
MVRIQDISIRRKPMAIIGFSAASCLVRSRGLRIVEIENVHGQSMKP